MVTAHGDVPTAKKAIRGGAYEFIEKPPTPPYVPKKSGIDKITQIEDYDLFDYGREV